MQSRKIRSKSENYNNNVTKRGAVTTGKQKKSSVSVGPMVLGFFIFVVVGSALLQIIRQSFLLSFSLWNSLTLLQDCDLGPDVLSGEMFFAAPVCAPKRDGSRHARRSPAGVAGPVASTRLHSTLSIFLRAFP
eukprot:tig00000900_g5371.t1